MQDKSHSNYIEKTEYDINPLDEKLSVLEDLSSLREVHLEEQQFTWRATIVGSLLGCLVGNNFF